MAGVPGRLAPQGVAALPPGRGQQSASRLGSPVEQKAAPKAPRKQSVTEAEKLLKDVCSGGLGGEGKRHRKQVVRLGDTAAAAPDAPLAPEAEVFKSAEEELGGCAKRRAPPGAPEQQEGAKRQRSEQTKEQAALAAVSTPTPPGSAPVAVPGDATQRRPQRAARQQAPCGADDTESDGSGSGGVATIPTAARPPKARAPGKQRGVEKLLTAVANAPRSAPADAPPAVVTLHTYGSDRVAVDPAVVAGTQPTLWCDVGTSSPGPLLRGSDPQFWGALRCQGAMVVKIQGAWDGEANTSAVADLDWLFHSTSSTASMKHEFQYISQALPRAADGLVVLHADDEPLSGRLPFGALLDDVAKTFKRSGKAFTGMPVPAREKTFLNLARSGDHMEFTYIQGLTLAAHGSSTQPWGNGLLRAIPAGGAHSWETSGLATLPGSVLTHLLKACEAVCNPSLRHDIAVPPGDGPGSDPAAAATASNEAAATAGRARNSGRLRFADSAEDEAQRERVILRRAKDGHLPECVATAVTATLKGPGKAAPSRAAPADAPTAPVAPAAADLAAGLARSEAQMDEFVWGAGIVSPWVYLMGVFSSFGAHFEDYAFGSANAILAAPGSEAYVVWYSVPREQLAVMHEFLQHLRGAAYSINCLEERRLWVDPAHVAAWNAQRAAKGKPQLQVYRHVQGPGEYVVTDYGSVHWGVNLGVGWKSAVNFGCEEWHAAATHVDGVYAALEAKTQQTRHHRTCPRLSTDPQAQAAFAPVKLRALAAEGLSPGGSQPLAPLEAREAAGRAAYAAAWARLRSTAAQ